MDPTKPKKKKDPIDMVAATLDSLNRSPLRDSLGGGRVRPIIDDRGLLGSYERGRPTLNLAGDFDAPTTGGIPSRKRDVRSTFIHESGHALQASNPVNFKHWNEIAKGLPSFETTPDAKGAWGKPGNWDGYTEAKFPGGSVYHSTDEGRVANGLSLVDLLPFMKRGRKMSPSESSAFGALDKYYTGAEPKSPESSPYPTRSKPNEQFATAFTNAFSFLSETAKNPGDYRRRIGELEAATPGMGQVVLDILKTMPQFANHPLRAAFGVK